MDAKEDNTTISHEADGLPTVSKGGPNVYEVDQKVQLQTQLEQEAQLEPKEQLESTEDSHQPALPSVPKCSEHLEGSENPIGPTQLKDPEQPITSDIQGSPQVLASPDRPRTPPTDDSRQTFGLGDGHSSENKLHPPVLFRAPQSPSVESSSPERDTLRVGPARIRHAIGNAEMRALLGESLEPLSLVPSSQGSMPPPQTPLPPSGRRRRRQSDAIESSKTQPPKKRNRGLSISNASSPDKLVGITRRGFVRETDNSGGSPKGTAAAKHDANESPAKTPTIRRVIIKSQGETITDKQLATPMTLSHTAAASEITKVPSSPVYPLPESVVFGGRGWNDATAPSMTSAQMFHPPTPHPSSSPTRKPPKPRSLSPRKKPRASIGQRGHNAKSVDRREQRDQKYREREQLKQMAELDAAWKMPELSKDSVVSFAEEGPWRTSGNGKGGVWRQIRSARPGYFKESEVLFGVRYLIG